MREIDRLTTERYAVPSLLLMDSASASCRAAIKTRYEGDVAGLQVLILCGKGNNGGDGAGIAQLLADEGAQCTVVLFGLLLETQGDARVNFDHARERADSVLLTFIDGADIPAWDARAVVDREHDVLID